LAGSRPSLHDIPALARNREFDLAAGTLEPIGRLAWVNARPSFCMDLALILPKKVAGGVCYATSCSIVGSSAFSPRPRTAHYSSCVAS